jgi:hypothetical protein
MVVDAKKQARWWNLWPKISDAESARRAAMRGCWAAVISAVVTALVVAAGLYGLETVQGVDAYALVDVALLVLLAWGIRKMFRTAAVIALVYFVGSKVLLYSANGVGNPIVFIVFCLLYINGVRGTYAYRQFKDGGVAAA